MREILLNYTITDELHFSLRSTQKIKINKTEYNSHFKINSISS